jgi:deoxyribonuclease V
MIDFKKAAQVQDRLAQRLRLVWDQKEIKTIAGIDCAYDTLREKIGAVVVVCRLPTFQVIETASDIRHSAIPYVPGFLNYREAPVCLRAFRKLLHPPDVTLLDGNGIAHPRKMGLASYVGLIMDISTIGCAKNPFFPYSMPEDKTGSYTDFQNHTEETVGVCIRTREKVKPVFVSPGHRITLSQARKIVIACSKTRIPEPLRLAHLKASLLFKRPSRIG